jgi:hypothetical protein
MMIDFPWRESIIILLLLWLDAGMRYVRIKPEYISFVAKYRWVRFLIIFLVSYLYFSLEFRDGQTYPIPVKIFAALMVSTIFDAFLSADAVLNLPAPPRK